jgi:hypothetical protein
MKKYILKTKQTINYTYYVECESKELLEKALRTNNLDYFCLKEDKENLHSMVEVEYFPAVDPDSCSINAAVNEVRNKVDGVQVEKFADWSLIVDQSYDG